MKEDDVEDDKINVNESIEAADEKKRMIKEGLASDIDGTECHSTISGSTRPTINSARSRS